MAQDVCQPAPVYSAFLSYSRQDAAIAQRVLSRLESYRLPRRLHPRTGAWNDKTRRLKQLFRDLDEMTVAPDIDSAVREAMAASAYLIVLCSPQSAKSDWVSREIEMFRAMHGDTTILTALIEGTPATAFHPALLHNVGGALMQPLAADFRPEGDGPQLARLKLVAGMAGVPLGELVRRDAQRRMRQFALAAAALLVFLGIVAALIITAQRSRQDAVQQSARAGTMSRYMLDDLRDKLKRYGSLGMLAEVNQGVMETFRGRSLAGLSDAEREQLAKLRLAIGEDAEQRGDLAGARIEIAEAGRITAARLAAAPDDPQRIFDHAQSQYYIALVDWLTNDRSGAQAAFQAYRDLAGRLVAADARNADWSMEVGYAEENLGMYALRSQLDTGTAAAHFRDALKAFQTTVRLRPNDRDAASAITDTYAWLGDTLRLRGDYVGARANRTLQRQILDSMRVADPRDRQVESEIVTNDLAMARIDAAEGQLQRALDMLDRGRTGAVAVAQSDPDNVRRAAQVRIFDLFKLRTWLAMPISMRPSAAVLAKTNGNCKDDEKRLKNTELAEFCAILAARRQGLAPPASNATPVDALSERWGIDFAKERTLTPARVG